jgi:hypothetical protein
MMSTIVANQQHASLKRPVIALLTDFGSGDGTVGVMKGVITGITPWTQLIDITHEIAPQDVAAAAWILGSAYRYFPAGAVFVCVVDPGVGSERRAIALHTGSWFFVGPDNGLFSGIVQEQPVHGAVELANPAYRLPQVSSSFHGRDIFAPTAAYLAANASEVFSKLGPALDPARLLTLPTRNAIRRGNTIEASILHVDHFGNLITSIPLNMVPELFTAHHVQVTFPEQGVVINQRRRFFGDGADDGQPFLYRDSSGYLGIAVRNGSATRALGRGAGTPIVFETSAS